MRRNASTLKWMLLLLFTGFTLACALHASGSSSGHIPLPDKEYAEASGEAAENGAQVFPPGASEMPGLPAVPLLRSARGWAIALPACIPTAAFAAGRSFPLRI